MHGAAKKDNRVIPIEIQKDENTQTLTHTKKVLIRRSGMVAGKWRWHDVRRVQLWRHGMQAGFVLLNVYLCVLFYIWVRYYESGLTGIHVDRPAGVEGWLPIAGLMNLKYWLVTWEVPYLHAASMFLLVAFLCASMVLKKAFCSWLCPVGTLSEVLYKGGRRIFGRSFYLPWWLDMFLRSLKYLLLGAFISIAVVMSAQDIAAFMKTPYGLIADVKMLNFFRYISPTALGVVMGFVIASVFIPHFWCRYLCPYGALMGLVSLFSPFKIRRDESACIDCAKCARVCPSRLPVDQKLQICSAECNACMSCVDVCPAQDALQFSVRPLKKKAPNGDERAIARRWQGRKLTGAAVAVLLAVIVGGVIISAKISGHWQSSIPPKMYEFLIPRAQSLAHP